MAGMRNLLVHNYDTIDDTLMYGVLKKHLPDFSAFLREIREKYLQPKQATQEQ
jgi:uncharacterized protein YutE (UPF0331/DUF86 family)